MNKLLRRRTSGLISHVLVLAMITPTLMLTLAGAPARAQSPTLAVGVIDFRNESGLQGETLSRLATDAVALELAKQAAFDILQRTSVTQQMKELGLTPPLSKIGVAKLGEALLADAMVDGAIREVQIRGTGGNRRAAVTLIVRMLDQASGEVINGGIQTGYSNPRVGYSGDDDTLITEAIDNAAFLIVKTMAEYIIPEATVQNSIGENQVLLNKGSRDGIKRGMRMIVKRDKEIIGYLAVSSVSPSDAIATVVRAMRGVKAEDKATAIFDMPAVSEVRADPSSGSLGAPPTKKSANKMSKGKTILLGLLVVGGLLALLNTGGSGSENPGAASARLTANGVNVTWNPSNLWGGKNVVEAHVWRDDVLTPIWAGRWDSGIATDTLIQRVVAYNTADKQTLDRVGGQTNVPDIQYGRTYTYRVSALYVVNSVAAKGEAYYESELSFAGRVTPIQQIIPNQDFLAPTAGAPVDRLSQSFYFQWVGRTGADRYIVQVSSSANFPTNGQTWSNINRPIVWNPDVPNPTMTLQPDDSLRGMLGNIAMSASDDVTMWWRVGYCNSRDTSFDGSLNSYMFSAPATFIVPKEPAGPGTG